MSEQKSNTSVKTKVVIFALATAFAFGGLLYALEGGTKVENSVMVNEPVPSFQLPGLYDQSRTFSRDDILRSDYFLINVWASWCAACKSEHGFLTQLQHQGVVIVGLNYRDERKPALAMLKQLGDPYDTVIYDVHGSLALDLGVIGAPETFLISPAGEIVYRFSGVLDQQVWHKQFAPLIAGEKQ